MNIDLTKGTLANVLLIGIGTLFGIAVCFIPDGLSLFSGFTGYFLSVLLGFILIPHLRIRESAVYYKETSQIITLVGSLITDQTKIAEKLARPAYDLFLREIPNGDRIITRIHDLGQQIRFMYALSRLFAIYSLLLGVTGLLKIIGTSWSTEFYKRILWFLPDSDLVAVLSSLFVLAGMIYLSFKFQNGAERILRRQRGMERMAVLLHKEFFSGVAERIRQDPGFVDKLFPYGVEKVPDVSIQS